MTELVKVNADENSVLDVVFVHGLDGDPRKSWSAKSKDSFWPEWLAQDVPLTNVWCLGYDAASSRWLGHAMPIQDRAINLLAQLENYGIGQRALCFVTHSMGGLVVKEMLLHAAEGRAGYAEFATAARGAVFLATPHIGSDLVAKTVFHALGVVYRKTLAVDALERNSAHLRQLNDRYRDWASQPDVPIKHCVFYETQPTQGVRVVDAGSANPGLPGVRPIAVDANHIDICKPVDRNNLVYGQVKRFIAALTRQEEGMSITGSQSGSGVVSGDADAPRDTAPANSAEVWRDVTGIVATGDHLHLEQHNHVHHYQPQGDPAMDQVQPPASAVFNVPARSAMFVGRDGDLVQLHRAMTSTRSGTVVVSAVHGLGGVGKSTLAAHYAHAHRDEWSLVWWITADTASSIESGLADLAIAIWPRLVQAPSEQQAELARQWLATHTDWLLILDNLNQPTDAAALLSRLHRGRVLITSRRADGWHTLAAAVKLDVLGNDDAVALVIKILRAHSPEASVEGAAELCRVLGCLPLAIEQAGAYMAETSTSPAEYLDLLARYPAAMYGETAEGGDAQRTMARIWRLTLNKLADTPLAGRVLRMLAWYAPDDIPATLLSGLADELLLRKAIGRLHAYSMITHRRGIISVHRLVQAVTRTPDPEDPHRTPQHIGQGCEDATRALAQHLEQLDHRAPKERPTCQALLKHVPTITSYTDAADDTHDTIAVLGAAGVFLFEYGQTADALNYLRRCHTSRERLYGSDHPEALSDRSNLAHAYLEAGDLKRAVRIFEAVLADRERVLGVDHDDTLSSRSNLALAYLEAGDLKRAVRIFEAVLADRERVFGVDHADTLLARNNLALAYKSAGDLKQAIPLYEAVAADHVRMFGVDHFGALASRNNLAHAYLAAGELRRAILLFKAVAADCLRVLEADHPHTLTSRNNLAEAYLKAGNLGRAVPLFEAVLADRVRVLGPDHPHTLLSRSNLAAAYLEAGDVKQAIPLSEAVLADRVRVLGADHPRTLGSRNNLAQAYLEAGDLERAISMLAVMLADAERILGDHHPTTKIIRSNLRNAQKKRR